MKDLSFFGKERKGFSALTSVFTALAGSAVVRVIT